ncbi:MAG: MFS transporter, partial [Bacteroidia bacterium]|nr:MFS transporter [Bacteroidia bacterium]
MCSDLFDPKGRTISKINRKALVIALHLLFRDQEIMTENARKVVRTYKKAYSGHPPAIWLISGITLINRMGSMVIPFLSVYLTTVLGYSLTTAGYLVSAYGLGSLVGSYLGGKLTDRFGSSNLILFSLFFGGISFICLQFAEQIIPLFVMIFITSALSDCYRPAMSTFVGNNSPGGTAGRSMALVRIAVNLGMALGPALGGFIAVLLGYKALFWIDGITCIIAGIILKILLKRIPIAEEDIRKSPDVETHSTSKIYHDKKYVRMLVVTFFMAICFLQWFHTVPVFIKTEWGFDERYIGSMMAINCLLIVLIEMPLVDILESRGKMSAAMRMGLIFFIGCFMPFFFNGGILLYIIAVILFSFGEILFLPFNNAYAINLSPSKNRGAYMSWYWMVWGFSSIIAPLVGFQLVATVGYYWFWTIMG